MMVQTLAGKHLRGSDGQKQEYTKNKIKKRDQSRGASQAGSNIRCTAKTISVVTYETRLMRGARWHDERGGATTQRLLTEHLLPVPAGPAEGARAECLAADVGQLPPCRT